VISENLTLYDAIRRMVDYEDDLRFIIHLLDDLKETWNDGKNPGKFMETICRIVRPWTSIKKLSEEIEDWVEDALARDASAGEAVVRVLTMEAAKGLGSDQVFIIGLNKGVFPDEGLRAEKIREKQRLLYVSMTRAKKKLNIFYSRVREGRLSYQAAPNGKGRGILERSPFLNYIPKKIIEFEKRWSSKKREYS
jgi:superfamily I DNA/RNA helicase